MTVPRTPITSRTRAEEEVNENAEICDTSPRADQLNPEDNEFINRVNNQENQQLPANDDFENDQKHPFSSSNQVERVCTAEEAAVLAAQLTAERVRESLKQS